MTALVQAMPSAMIGLKGPVDVGRYHRQRRPHQQRDEHRRIDFRRDDVVRPVLRIGDVGAS